MRMSEFENLKELRENKDYVWPIVYASGCTDRNKEIVRRCLYGETYKSIAADFDLHHSYLPTVIYLTVQRAYNQAVAKRTATQIASVYGGTAKKQTFEELAKKHGAPIKPRLSITTT